MAIYATKVKLRKWVAPDGSSQASPKAWTDFCTSGTSASLSPLAKEAEWGGQEVDVWFVVSLQASQAYTMSYGDSYYCSLDLHSISGTRLAYESYDEEEGAMTPITYTPAAGGLFLVHAYSSEDISSLVISPRPQTYTNAGWGPWEASSGLDGIAPRRFFTSADAGIGAGIPAHGVVFEMDPANPLIARTGQEMRIQNGTSVDGGVVEDGIPCLRFRDGAYLQAVSWAAPSGNTPKSVSAWIKADTSYSDSWSIACWGQDGSTGKLWNFEKSPEQKLSLNGYYADVAGTVNLKDGQWHHCCAVYYGGRASVFVDGVQDGTGSVTLNTGTVIPFRLGGNNSGDSDHSARGLIAAFRIYDRALMTYEVLGLSKEFSP